MVALLAATVYPGPQAKHDTVPPGWLIADVPEGHVLAVVDTPRNEPAMTCTSQQNTAIYLTNEQAARFTCQTTQDTAKYYSTHTSLQPVCSHSQTGSTANT